MTANQYDVTSSMIHQTIQSPQYSETLSEAVGLAQPRGPPVCFDARLDLDSGTTKTTFHDRQGLGDLRDLQRNRLDNILIARTLITGSAQSDSVADHVLASMNHGSKRWDYRPLTLIGASDSAESRDFIAVQSAFPAREMKSEFPRAYERLQSQLTHALQSSGQQSLADTLDSPSVTIRSLDPNTVTPDQLTPFGYTLRQRRALPESWTFPLNDEPCFLRDCHRLDEIMETAPQNVYEKS